MASLGSFADLPQYSFPAAIELLDRHGSLPHGFGLDRRMWDDQGPKLERHGRAIRYDMRGHGQSDVPGSEPYTSAGDFKALLEHLQAERPVVIGLSLGSTVALQFAQVYPRLLTPSCSSILRLAGGAGVRSGWPSRSAFRSWPGRTAW